MTSTTKHFSQDGRFQGQYLDTRSPEEEVQVLTHWIKMLVQMRLKDNCESRAEETVQCTDRNALLYKIILMLLELPKML